MFSLNEKFQECCNYMSPQNKLPALTQHKEKFKNSTFSNLKTEIICDTKKYISDNVMLGLLFVF